MECKEFERHIYNYFTDPNFDWWLKRQINAHYLKCNKCFNTLKVTKLLADKEVMADVALKMIEDILDKAATHEKEGKYPEAIKCLLEVLELKPRDEKIEKKINEISPYLLTLFVNDQKKPLSVESIGIIGAFIEEPETDVGINFAGHFEWSHHITGNPEWGDEQFRTRSLESKTIHELNDIKSESLSFETDNLIIEIHKGRYAGKILIKIKQIISSL